MAPSRRLLTLVLSAFSLLLVASAGFAASRPDAAVHRTVTERPAAGNGEAGQVARGTGGSADAPLTAVHAADHGVHGRSHGHA